MTVKEDSEKAGSKFKLKTFAPWEKSNDKHRQCRDIILPRNVCIVKAMVFPVVMYGCESWTIKKAEHIRTDAFKLVLEKTLESPLDCKEIQPVHPKRRSVLSVHRKD